MRFVTQSTFKRLKDCADAFVSDLRAPEDGEWITFVQRDWTAIVGTVLAAQTVPGKLWFAQPGSGAGGCLTVFVSSQGAASVLHHEASFMREAINKHYKQNLVRVVRVRAR